MGTTPPGMHDLKTSAYKEEWIKMVEHFESKKYIWSRLAFLRDAAKFKAGIAVKTAQDWWRRGER